MPVLIKRPSPVSGRRPRVGLLGGSFNPAHGGHRHISRLALERLGLDEVWWLVSPQNPLKPVKGMAPLADRLASARAMARGRNMWATDIEHALGTNYTADTLKALKSRFPNTRFVWIMGADNLIDIDRWNDWTAIFETVPVAVFARPAYSFKALTSTAAKRFAGRRIHEQQSAELVSRAPPAWVFLHIPLSSASATKIRDGFGG
ncbi:MAG: nicotinate-nucleotide adenylyltransferase [Rhodospirillales bacterium]|nr:nicotinate-nucleotide adenylyltransferase [Alphaproteobacteria bacterium]MBL6947574.1 nicotinate-nucleotide adenylyltransferase [Rhodospirillales bacterium]